MGELPVWNSNQLDNSLREQKRLRDAWEPPPDIIKGGSSGGATHDSAVALPVIKQQPQDHRMRPAAAPMPAAAPRPILPPAAHDDVDPPMLTMANIKAGFSELTTKIFRRSERPASPRRALPQARPLQHPLLPYAHDWNG